ncbi:MAG: polysaccharide pyruvyl transferase family protein [Verrucomicrobia bacterium]|nr:polysaccharide pyruvyl transferase family protein [Verrucomicrobiota bacterium]
MKLFYWSTIRNFGDLLNAWLWHRLIPECFDDDPSTVFLGIGTILNQNHGIERLPRKVVMGSGVGYGRLPVLDSSWQIYCLRGPRSVRALGLSPDLAITDPGLLVRRFVSAPERGPRFKFAFMPHFYHNLDAWRCVCADVGIAYINPQEEVETVIAQIRDCEVLLTEAMHGAIISDALSRPWVPVRIDDRILDFKWLDWCESVGLTYQPHPLPRLFELPQDNDFVLRQHTRVTRFIARQALRRLVRQAKPVLSDRKRLDELEVCLLDRIERFREDCVAGRFQRTACVA